MTTQVNTLEQVKVKKVAEVGEDIGFELGLKMVKDYYDANPNFAYGNMVGKNILQQILAQPGCEGITFYPALNDDGSRTIVYVGVDKDGAEITKYVMASADGSLEEEEGIIGDKGSKNGWWKI